MAGLGEVPKISPYRELKNVAKWSATTATMSFAQTQANKVELIDQSCFPFPPREVTNSFHILGTI